MKKYLVEFLNGERPLIDVWHYLVGHYRNLIFFTRFKWLLRKHIVEQIEFRMKVMKKECYENGECVICGCSTPALQMCNKSCEGDCYPDMVGKYTWKTFKRTKKLIDYVAGNTH